MGTPGPQYLLLWLRVSFTGRTPGRRSLWRRGSVRKDDVLKWEGTWTKY